MNRRSFLGKIGAAVAGFTVLPPATTYDRIWKATLARNTLIDTNYNCVIVPSIDHFSDNLISEKIFYQFWDKYKNELVIMENYSA